MSYKKGAINYNCTLFYFLGVYMNKEIKQLTSVNNEQVKYFYSLYDKKTRSKEQLFIIEGHHLVEEASKTNHLKIVLSTNEVLLQKYTGVEKYLINNAILEKLSSTKNPQPILGISSMLDFTEKHLDNILKQKEVKLILLDDINDPGNLGTIIRTTAALGYDGIIMSEATVDLYNDKVVRSTQGVMYKIPLFKMELTKAINYLKASHVYCMGTSLKNAVSLKNAPHKERFAICFGNEARGMNDKHLDLMDKNIMIDMLNDVESLNVSVASSIVMWELKK